MDRKSVRALAEPRLNFAKQIVQGIEGTKPSLRGALALRTVWRQIHHLEPEELSSKAPHGTNIAIYVISARLHLLSTALVSSACIFSANALVAEKH